MAVEPAVRSDVTARTATRRSWNAVAIASAVPIASGCHASGPTGSPTVRDHAHAALMARLPAIPTAANRRVGRRWYAIAQPPWNSAAQ